MAEGMDVARLNFSHGDHDFYKKLIGNIRACAKKARKNVAILQDLQGPKLRVGKLPQEGFVLNKGDTIYLYAESPNEEAPAEIKSGKKTILPISSEIAQAIVHDAKVGARILFDDGKIQGTIGKIGKSEIVVEIEYGGRITSHKGINLPGTPLSIPCVTAKDLQDLKFGLEQGVDAVALSFVRSASDIETVKERIRRQSDDQPFVIAKIEREEAIDNMQSIIEASDGLLIARGDMAVELGAPRVPIIQKTLIHQCNHMGVPVITATQMLESMIFSPTPTRAEASDVANAVFDGTDAVMLSGETASGEYPLETVRTMSRIILEAERAQNLYSGPRDILPIPGSVPESIEFSASRVAHHVDAVAIACISRSGMAARILAKFRPSTPIVAIMDNEAGLRRLAMVWGVKGVLIKEILATDDLFAMVEKVLIEEGWAEPEDLVTVTAGVPTLKRGTTNMIKVHRISSQWKKTKTSK
jgi:pyruvate kinase